MRKTSSHRSLRAGALAALICFGLLSLASPLLGFWEDRYLDRLVPTGEDEVVKGQYLVGEALRRPDTLLLLGSSELTFQDEFHAAHLFAGRPTGFSVVIVGSGYRQSIHNFLVIGALGRALKDRQVALFLSPSWFTPTMAPKAYQKNFSPLQAYEFAYTSTFSSELKQRGAERLLTLGSPGTDDPVLNGTLQALAQGGAAGKARYALLWPVGRLTLSYLQVKDRVDLARLILKKYRNRQQPVRADEMDWAGLSAQAEAAATAQTNQNDFRMSNDYYTKYIAAHLAELKDSDKTVSWLNSSEYGDLQLVLDALRETGARPLFISLPVLGKYYDFKGHTVTDRLAYYAQVDHEITAAGFPVADFGDREYEFGFMRDPWHPGWKGAVAIDEALDEFVHGRMAASRH